MLALTDIRHWEDEKGSRVFCIPHLCEGGGVDPYMSIIKSSFPSGYAEANLTVSFGFHHKPKS